MTKRTQLSRRTVLKGLLGGSAVSVALPPLEIFMNTIGSAYAQASAFPSRFCLFSWGNGVHPNKWIPEQTGENWQPNEQMIPLLAHREYLSVCTGFEVKAPNNDAHTSGPCGFLSGRPLDNTSGSYSFTGPTVDQMIASEIGADTQFKSVEVAVEPGARGLSFNGQDSRNPPESDPMRLFNRLFGETFRAPGSEPILDPTLALRRSVLDVVLGEGRALNAKLGSADRRRLDQHMNSIRELELRIARLEEDPPNLAACSRPPSPCDPSRLGAAGSCEAFLGDIDGRPQMSGRAQIMNELITMAYACDLTRVLSYSYSDPLSDVLYFDAQAGHHQLTHDEPGDLPTVNRITTATMADLGDLLTKLRAVEEGDGNLLDHMALLATTDFSYARTHQIDEYPILLAGKANGRLRSGVHIRSETKDNAAMIPLTVVRAMGIAMDQYGEGPDETTQSLSGLEVNE